MRSREEIEKDWEELSTQDNPYNIVLEVLLDIRDFMNTIDRRAW